MMAGINSGAALMQDSGWRFDVAAHNLANINTAGFQAQRVDGSPGNNDVASQMVDSMVSADTYKLGAAIMSSSNDMLKSLIDIKA